MNLSKIYKRGQGANTRLATAVAVFVVILAGCWVLHEKLKPLGNIWIETLVPFGLCGLLSGVLAWVMNMPSVADFLIAAESEIKKVSWASRSELIASTTVVIVVVVVMAIGLYAVDLGFSYFFKNIVGL